MEKKGIFITVFLCLLVVAAYTQKRPLDAEAYSRWQRVEDQDISEDGRWVSYRIAWQDGHKEEGERPRTCLYDTEKRKTLVLEGTERVAFLAKGKWITFVTRDTAANGRDTTWLMRLKVRKKIRWEKEVPFQPVWRSDLITWQYDLPAAAADSSAKKQPFRRLVIYNVEKGDSVYVDSIGNYFFYNHNRSLIYQKKLGNYMALYTRDLAGGQQVVFDDPRISVGSFSWDDRRQGGTFSVASDSLVYRFSLKDQRCQLIFRKDWIAVPEGMKVRRLDLSAGDGFVTYELEPVREKRPEKKPEPDKSFELQLWTWNEVVPQSRQEKEGYRPGKKYPKYIFYISSRKSVKLAGEEVDHLYWPEDKTGHFVLATVKEPYYKFSDIREALHADIWLVNRHTGERRLLLTDQAEAPVWGPQGKYALLYDSRAKVWYALNGLTGEMADVSTAIGYPVYNEEHDKPCPAHSYGIAGWLAGGEKVLLCDRYDWWLVDLTGTEAPRCYTRGWGRKNKTSVRLLRSNFDPKVLDLQKKIWVETFCCTDKKQSVSCLLPGGRLKTLMQGDYAYRIYKLSDDQQACIFTRQNYRESRDLWWSKTDFARPVKITHINPQQKEYLWGEVKLMNWTNYEGKQNQGLLYLPENYDSSRKYPLLVQFYETHSDDLNVYLSPAFSMAMADIPTYVSNGYIVFMPDVHFTVGNPGQSSYDAVISGVQMLIERGIADKDRIGLQGHSWSGFQTAYLVTQTGLFRCANIGAPITDMVSGYLGIRNGSGLIRFFMYEDTQSRMGKSLWEDKAGYLRNSVLLNADKITTPLLIFHNDADEAVAYEQGRALYLAMRRLQKPAWLLNYKGDRHFLYNPAAQRDWTLRMQQFYDYYLKGTAMPRWMKEGINVNERGIDQKYEYVK